MPMFYFHLSNCDECFRDNIGCDLADIAVAHTRAKRLAHRVMMISRLATTDEPDWRRWIVTVTDDPQGPMLIIPFGAFGIVPLPGSKSAFVPADHAGGNAVCFGSKAGAAIVSGHRDLFPL
jgi:hypothetical protein